MAEDLAKWPWSSELRVFHYIDDILLTSDSLAVREGSDSSAVIPEVMGLDRAWTGPGQKQAARA